jgi:hypothetical protein
MEIRVAEPTFLSLSCVRRQVAAVRMILRFFGFRGFRIPSVKVGEGHVQ